MVIQDGRLKGPDTTCLHCGTSRGGDPALLVECPEASCQAKVGEVCKRPSGHPVYGHGVHSLRDRVAMAFVPGYYPCPHTTKATAERVRALREAGRCIVCERKLHDGRCTYLPCPMDPVGSAGNQSKLVPAELELGKEEDETIIELLRPSAPVTHLEKPTEKQGLLVDVKPTPRVVEVDPRQQRMEL